MNFHFLGVCWEYKGTLEMFDRVIDLMVNLGYQMVEDCLCY